MAIMNGFIPLKGQPVIELVEGLGNLLSAATDLALTILGRYWVLLIWLAWALWAINWKKVWPNLVKGAWAPGVLALIFIALIWSQLQPESCDCLGFVTLPNFWWQ